MRKEENTSISIIEIVERLIDDPLFRPMSLIRKKDLIQPENKVFPCEEQRIIGTMDFFEQRLYSLIKIKAKMLVNREIAEKVINLEISLVEGEKRAGPGLEKDIGDLQEIMILEYLLLVMIRNRLDLSPMKDFDLREGFKILNVEPEIDCSKCDKFCPEKFKGYGKLN